MIQRDITPKIRRSLGFYPVVGIVGSRQVGKTTLVKMLQPETAMPGLYLDLELQSDRIKLSRAEWYLQQHTDKCVIIDEVQRMPELFPLIRALVDQHRVPGRFILLGSASPALIQQSSESLAGRIAYHELDPFSLAEVGGTAQQLKHWFRGGFPNAWLAPDDEMAQEWLRNFTRTFIERDLGLMGLNVSPIAFDRLMIMLAHYHGALLNVSEFSRSLGISVQTVNRYLDILEGAFIIHRLAPWFNNLSKRLVKSPKVYFRDSGLFHSLMNMGSMEQLSGHPSIGASWEAYVIEEVRKTAPSGTKFWFYRTHAGAEADLIMEMPGGKMICCEIKLSMTPTPSRGFYQSAIDLQPDKQYIIVPDGEQWMYNENITVINLVDFLQVVTTWKV